MGIVSIRLNQEEEQLLKKFSEFEDITVSSFIKKCILERLEDEYDLKLIESSYQKYLDTDKKSYSLEDVEKELNIDFWMYIKFKSA